jgi:ABC-2 type transport system ATP-binding protein
MTTRPATAQPVAAPVISIRDLHKRYGDHEAVRGIDLEVRRGEIFAFLGPNGAGKTTTVEIMEGFHEASGGLVEVLGRDPWRAPASWRARIGIVLQESEAEPGLSVRECLGLYAGYYPAPRNVDDTLALVDLADQSDQRASALSGGQRRRLDVALALIGDPELIFLDEPTTGFDPAARRTAWQTIRSLKGLGKTVLLTTHYLDEAQELADRVAIIKGGQILAEGSPAELGVGAGSRYRVAYVNHGEPVIQQTDDPTSLLHALTADALARGERLEGLSVTRPSLEEIYLELTADG